MHLWANDFFEAILNIANAQNTKHTELKVRYNIGQPQYNGQALFSVVALNSWNFG